MPGILCAWPRAHERVAPAPAEGPPNGQRLPAVADPCGVAGRIGELWGQVPGVRRRSRPAVAGRPPATGDDPQTGRGAIPGRWTVEVVGSYERGHRAVTVIKLAELAEFYGLTTADLLPALPATTAPIGGGRFTVDLDRLADLPARQGGPLARYASTIQQQRGDHGGTVLTIREQGPAVSGRHPRHGTGRPDGHAAALGCADDRSDRRAAPTTDDVGKASTDRSEGHGTAAPGDV
jgi:hypothetical protein